MALKGSRRPLLGTLRAHSSLSVGLSFCFLHSFVQISVFLSSLGFWICVLVCTAPKVSSGFASVLFSLTYYLLYSTSSISLQLLFSPTYYILSTSSISLQLLFSPSYYVLSTSSISLRLLFSPTYYHKQ